MGVEDIKDWLFHASTITVGVFLGEWGFRVADEWGRCWQIVVNHQLLPSCSIWWLP